MEKQNIVTKIISDAEAKGLDLVSNARAKAEKIVAEETASCEGKRLEQMEVLALRGEEILTRREINARLDCNKLTLSARREVLDSVFERALNKLCSLGEGEYVALIDGILKKHAEDGDKVVLASSCKFCDKIKTLPVISERNLSVENKGVNFKGGVMLVGSKCDKNLSFEALILSIKEEKQAEIASRLFD